MADTKFPPNPTDGMIFESSPGVFFQYSTSLRCWKKLEGLDNVGLATPSKPGLMSREDFQKIQDILIPPLETTITRDECNTVFREGQVKLESSKGDLDIEHHLKVHLPDGEIDGKDFVIHDNTFGIDFRINIDRLIEELEKRGNFRHLKTRGPAGDPGPRGDPGRDALETGPQGDPGDSGVNAPFPGTLVQDFTLARQPDIRQAVVDIQNDEDNPKNLIVTIGNVGNPSACPKRVRWKNRNSPWLLAISDLPFQCPPDNAACRVCDTDLFYLDSTPLLEEIQSRYGEIINRIKSEKEESTNKRCVEWRQIRCCQFW